MSLRTLKNDKNWKKALMMSELLSRGYQLHDKRKYEKMQKSFSDLYSLLFENLPKEKIELATSYFVKALVIHDKIEDNPNLNDIIYSEKWSEVQENFNNFCRILGINNEFAEKLTEGFKYHNKKTLPDFMQYILDAESIFLKKLIPDANKNLIEALACLYLSAFKFHDVHTHDSWKLGEEAIAIYYYTILQNKAKR